MIVFVELGHILPLDKSAVNLKANITVSDKTMLQAVIRLTKMDIQDQIYSVTQKKRELLKNPTKIEEIQEKKFIDRN